MRCSLFVLLCLSIPALAGPRTDTYGDPLPEGALARFGTVRYRVGTSEKWAQSPDGKTLAVQEWKAIAFWDVESGRVTARIPDPDGTLDAHLRFSPDGKHLVRANDGELRVWDAATRRPRYSRTLPHHVSGVAFFPDSSWIAVTAANDAVSVFDPAFGIRVYTTEVEAFAHGLSPGGRFLLGESDKHTLVLMDARTGRVRTRFPGLEWWKWRCVLSPDDSRLYATNGDGHLCVFDTRSAKMLEEIAAAAPPEWADRGGRDGLALSPDGNVAYLVKGNQLTLRRDLKAGKWLDPLPAMPDGELIPSPEGKRVLHIGTDGVLRRYHVETLKELPGRDEPADVFYAAVAPDGRRVALVRRGSGETRLELVDPTGRVKWSVSDPDSRGRPIWSPDGRWLACLRGAKGVALRDAATGKEVRHMQWPGDDHWAATWAQFLPGGERLLVSCRGELLVGFDVKTGASTGYLQTPESGGVAISADGGTMAFANCQRGVALYDLGARRWRVAYTLPPFPDSLSTSAIAFSPDGLYLGSLDDDGVLLRDAVSAAPIRTIQVGKRPAVGEHAFSPDGQWIALNTFDTLMLWDVASGQKLATWEGHRGHIDSIAFAGLGRVLTHAEDLTALLWDLRPKEKPTRAAWDALVGEDAVEGYRAVWAVAADPDGPELLRTKIAAAKPVVPERVKQLLIDLGADRYAVREAAVKELQDLGRAVEPELLTARAKATSEEVRTRLDALLAKIPRERSAAEVVHARAVAAMELAGTDAAKRVLADWAAGADGARLTRDARAALVRLGK
jgi:WD40 repeat protein